MLNSINQVDKWSYTCFTSTYYKMSLIIAFDMTDLIVLVQLDSSDSLQFAHVALGSYVAIDLRAAILNV